MSVVRVGGGASAAGSQQGDQQRSREQQSEDFLRSQCTSFYEFVPGKTLQKNDRISAVASYPNAFPNARGVV